MTEVCIAQSISERVDCFSGIESVSPAGVTCGGIRPHAHVGHGDVDSKILWVPSHRQLPTYSRKKSMPQLSCKFILGIEKRTKFNSADPKSCRIIWCMGILKTMRAYFDKVAKSS